MNINLSEECIVKLAKYEEYYLDTLQIDLNDYESSNRMVQEVLGMLINSGLIYPEDAQKEILMKYDLFLPMNFIEEFCRLRSGR